MNKRRVLDLTLVAAVAAIFAWWWPDRTSFPLRPPTTQSPAADQSDQPAATDNPSPESGTRRNNLPPGTAAPPTLASLLAAIDPQADLATAIPNALRVLTSQGFPDFLQSYKPPEMLPFIAAELNRALNSQEVITEARLQWIDQHQAPAPAVGPFGLSGLSVLPNVVPPSYLRYLLSALQSIQGKSPQFDPSGTVAIFPLAPPINVPGVAPDVYGPSDSVVFGNQNGRWYFLYIGNSQHDLHMYYQSRSTIP